ncbi:MAG: GNAT family N-acetyltransferase [Saprospiraceae bacterium]|nr:GNAT family N-acetyltransferase [Saprospiraceae bacterium]
MEFVITIELSKIWKVEILSLWNNEYPIQLNYNTLSDFESFLKPLTDQSHIVVVDDNQRIQGWYFDFIRDNARWFIIILDSNVHGQGLGTQLLNKAKEKKSQLNGWVIDHSDDKKRNGQFYQSPLNFYMKNGFKLLSDNRIENETISAVHIEWKKEEFI